MEERQTQLLKLIIESYIATAEPVGSKFLVEAAGLDVSGATVRNEMRELEESGYLTQPHTSAGRIPTEVGYRYYVEHIMKLIEPKPAYGREIEHIRHEEKELPGALKHIGKYTADRIRAAVIIAFDANSVYYTGISYLFAEPEFRDHAHMVGVSQIFDHCEEYIGDVYEAIDGKHDPQVLIGQDNPFGQACSLVVTPIEKTEGLFALMTPMRTNYARNLGLAKYIHEVF